MKKAIVIILSLIMIFSLSVTAFATNDIPDEIIPNERYRVAEVPELRDKNSDTYLLSDGTYECVVYSEDKYYADESGKLVEIDNSIIPTTYKSGTENYEYANAASATKVYFSEDKPTVLIAADKCQLEFSVV